MSALPPKADIQRIDLMSFQSSIVSLDRAPCRQFPLHLPSGAPPRAPCIRQTFQPRTAGARHGLPVRFDLAVHRGAAWALCMGLMVILISCLPPPPARLSSATLLILGNVLPSEAIRRIV